MWEPANITDIPTASDIIHAKNAIEIAEYRLVGALSQLEELRMQAKDHDTDPVNSLAERISHQHTPITHIPAHQLIKSGKRPDMADETERAVEKTGPSIASIQILANDSDGYLRRIKAWINPVRRLDHDVLSRIFELCAEVDWRSPLRLAVVSREWRNTVLTTPRAWEFIDLKYSPSPELVQAHFDRSGQRPLHIFLSNETPRSLLRSVAERIECISLDGYRQRAPDSLVQDAERICFPNVKKLILRGEYSDTWLSDISSTYFPSLRYLVSKERLEGGDEGLHNGSIAISAALERISIAAGRNAVWLSLLENRKDVLVSLTIEILPWLSDDLKRPVLPKLKCLVVGRPWFMDSSYWHVNTPVLETYVERTGQQGGLKMFHRDVGTVVALRIDCRPILSSLSNLRVLQIEGITVLDFVLTELLSDATLCPHLERMELLESLESPSRTELLNAALGKMNELRKRGSHRIQLTSVLIPDCLPLPGMIEEIMCGNDIPCMQRLEIWSETFREDR